jgi:hypothetical protein
MGTKTLMNEKCYVDYREEKKEIFASDKTDRANEPAFFTRSRRGIKKAWAAIEAAFGPETTMHDLLNICQANGIRCHYYCQVD